MKQPPLQKLLSIVVSAGCLLLGMVAARAAEGDWPQWRGPLGTGVAPEADPPVEWSETKNVRWKVALPGKGHSTPIVWGDRIFLTTAVPLYSVKKRRMGLFAGPRSTQKSDGLKSRSYVFSTGG